MNKKSRKLFAAERGGIVRVSVVKRSGREWHPAKRDVSKRAVLGASVTADGERASWRRVHRAAGCSIVRSSNEKSREKRTVRGLVTDRFLDPGAEAHSVGEHTGAWNTGAWNTGAWHMDVCHMEAWHKLRLVTVGDHGTQNRGMRFLQYLMISELCRKCGRVRLVQNQ